MGVTDEIKTVIDRWRGDSIPELISIMNEIGLAGGNLTIKKSSIIARYSECYCPSKELINTPNHCYCTQGWIKEVFENITGREINARVVKSIKWCDNICKIIE